MYLFSRSLTSKELIRGLQAGGANRRLFENRLYETFNYFIRNGQRKHRLSEDDCASAYGDAVLAVINNIVNGRFEERADLKTYLFQIFTNKCVDLIRKNTTNRSNVHHALSLDDLTIQVPDQTRTALQQLVNQSQIEYLHTHLRMLGDKCRQLLLAWGEGYSDEEIAQITGYNTAAVAKTSRLRCLERLREIYKTEQP